MKRHRGSLSATSMTDETSARPEDRPAMVGRFLIEEVIGRGGMSDVYRAYDPKLGRDVALKVLSPALGRNPEFRDRFLRESRSAAQLNHPHVVPIFEAGNDGDTLFIAMQLVRGCDLKTHIERHGPLSLDVLLSVIRQASEALDHAHQRGLLHRDVKPANLMLEEREGGLHVYLTDFGLTKSLGTDSRITHTGELVGSVHYVSPEHLEGRELDTRSDVYSLGCVLYECITGRPPFERDTDMAVLWAHLNAEVPRASKASRSVSHVVDRVIGRSMAKDPADRFSSCEDLVTSLDAALEGVAVDLPLPVKVESAPLGPKIRSAIAVGAALLIAVSSVVFAIRDPGQRSFAAPPSSEDGPTRDGTRDRRGTSEERTNERRPRGDEGSTEPLRSRSVTSEPGALQQYQTWSEESDRTDGGGDATNLTLVPTRTDRHNYDVRSQDLGLSAECSQEPSGCTELLLDSEERFLNVTITDQAGNAVGAFIKQDYDQDPNFDGPWISVCDATPTPVEVVAGARVQIVIDDTGCGGRSDPTLGTIVTQIYRAE